MNVIGFTYLLFLIKPSIEDDLLNETFLINSQNIKELMANVSSLWTEIQGIKTWTQQHEKGVNHNNFGNYQGHHHNNNHALNGYHPYANHALNSHYAYYGGHSHWHQEMFPPRVMYHYHDIVPGREHLFQAPSNGFRKHSSNRKKSDDSSEEEEEEEEEEKETEEKEMMLTNKDNKKEKEYKKKNKVKNMKEEEVKELEEEELGEVEVKKLEEEEVKKLEEEEVEREEVKKVEGEEEVKNGKVEENKEVEEVMNGETKENEETAKKVENFTEEELGDGEVKEDIKVKEEKKVEADEEEEEVKPRGRSLFGRKKKIKQGHKLGGLFSQHDRKGHKNTLVHNVKIHSKTKNHPVNHTKKLDENEIISKAFCDFEPNVEMPESKVTGNVTVFQKRNSKGPLYFHVNLQGFPVGQDEANRTHGFHIHVNPLSQFGHCNSTGPHFNPTGQSHGSLHSDIRHLGDFGNIVVDKNGRLDQYIFVDSTNTLVGENSFIFKSIDVHENPDDLGNGNDEGSLRSGNAGRKLACCTIHTLADALTKLNG